MEERDRAAAAVFFDRIAGHRLRDCVWDRTKAELRTWYRNSESEDDHGLRQNDNVLCSLDLFDRMAVNAWVATDAATVLGAERSRPADRRVRRPADRVDEPEFIVGRFTPSRFVSRRRVHRVVTLSGRDGGRPSRVTRCDDA